MKRIMIIGPGNAGKSTLAIKMAGTLQIPVFHLDQFYWLAGWIPKDKDLWEAEHALLLEKPEWIIEGDFSNLYNIRAKHADTIIFMDMPSHTLIKRSFLRRIIYRGVSRPDMTKGNVERFDYGYYRYIRWILRYDRSKASDLIKEHKIDKRIFILTNQKDINLFLDSLTS